jgi:2-polyprenyl-6-methoxyphenol hydroxylase-like FAD-dependent oxidoreductase
MTEIAIIGGLAAAAFLRRAGLTATVYEQAAQLREVGAGVVVAPNAARLLRALGVLDAFAERAVPLETGWEFRRWRDGRVPRTTRLQEVSHARAHVNHLPDGPGQRDRDAAFKASDPLAASGWIYAHDADALSG